MALAALLKTSSQTEHLTSGEDICRLFPDGTVIRKPGYCDRTIVCENHISTDGIICETSKFYNLKSKSCATKLEKSDEYCKTPCTAKTTGYVGDTFNCANWYKCDKATEVSKGVCPYGQYFDQTIKECVYPSKTTCNATFELCQVTPEGIKIKDEHNCHMWITCSAGKAVSNTCDNGLYYDVVSGDCKKKSWVSCEKHPHPEDACGTKKLAIRNKFVKDGATCSGYFYCRDLGSGVPDPSPTWKKCSNGLFFNEELQLCVSRNSCSCDEDRCDGRESGFELVEKPGCQHYIECENNAEKGDAEILKCDDGMYFNVEAQKCTTQKTEYGVCRA